MKLTRWSIILWMGLVFACGALLGALGQRVYSASSVNAANVGRPTPEETRKRSLANMKAQLGLNEDQITRIGVVMDESRVRLREARATIEPEVKKIREEQQAKIDQILTPEQQTKWNAVRQQREAERKSRAEKRD
jgi:Spy/CpxP family protein refolding chaperone